MKLKRNKFIILISFSFVLFFAIPFTSLASAEDNKTDTYRSSPEKINDLIHTKLNVSFNYKKRHLNGEAWITLKPHFYETDSLMLHAKGMDIKKVALVKDNKNLDLNFYYDSLFLKIKLDKSYTAKESYTIYINYTAKPDELKTKGSAAISNAKGLYFINPDSTEVGKPVQIWTQGETESSSVWFPTIDNPNQKTTQEISMTVPSKYVTLSNGKLISKTLNKDNTRTDTWKMDKPHAPYLFMMAVGDFRIYNDKWRDIPVDYYLEPAYAPYAKNIFGNTPEMIEFFSTKLGIDFPWNKYAQIVVRDYVSGAMENTTATVHGDFVQQTSRELLDGSAGEDVIAHELFHHWFGDYVTAESWSNLSVNESFADLSETLWNEYKYGKDAGDATNQDALQTYLNNPMAKNQHLIRFHYADKEGMFDVVSYQKGGRILNMLRNYLGEEAFFKSLNLYLKTNAFKTGEAHQLRLAFEEISGKDLNWFFNQWFFREGHPELSISYEWDNKLKKQRVILSQTQNTDSFILPIKIDIYSDGKKESHSYLMSKRTDTLSFNVPVKPDLVNVDADKILLLKKTDQKTIKEFDFQYKNAPLYLDRLEALEAAIKNSSDEISIGIILNATKDKFYKLRINAIEALDLSKKSIKAKALPILKDIIIHDEKNLVVAAAISALADLKDNNNDAIYKEALKSQSYAVQAAALNAIAKYDRTTAMTLAKKLETDSRGPLSLEIVSLYSSLGTEANFNFVSNAFKNGTVQDKFIMIQDYVAMLLKVSNVITVKENINELYTFGVRNKNYGIDKYIIGLLETYQQIKKDQLSKANSELKKNIQTQIDLSEESIVKLKLL